MKHRRTSYEEKWFDHDGVRIRYVDTGGGGEPLVFLHGLGGRIEDNDTIFPWLEDRYRVISFDMPGSGFSGKPDIDYSVHGMAEFSLDFVRRLGVEEMLLAGGSQGGLLTLLCCHLEPARVRKAAVYSPAGMFPPSPLNAKLLRALPPESVRLLMRVTSFFWNSPVYPGWLEERARTLDFIDNAEMPGFGRHVLGCLASQFETDFPELFAQIDTPVLIFWGKHDFGMPVAQGRKLDSIMRNSRLIELERTGHNAFNEKPGFCSEKLKEFFDGCA